MTLVPCPACSRAVSTAAFRCPECGHPVNRARRGVITLIVLAAILFGSLIVVKLISSWWRGG